jgi:hypothetical protein
MDTRDFGMLATGSLIFSLNTSRGSRNAPFFQPRARRASRSFCGAVARRSELFIRCLAGGRANASPVL